MSLQRGLNRPYNFLFFKMTKHSVITDRIIVIMSETLRLVFILLNSLTEGQGSYTALRSEFTIGRLIAVRC
jgi:hypothetical protein